MDKLNIGAGTEASMAPKELTAARALVRQLVVNGVDHVFTVPGESFLPVLDALADTDIQVTVCRQEGGAAMMADAYGKATGKPGICFVTRGPGATNASVGINVARQDSTPLIMFVGQIEREIRDREAFQENRLSRRLRADVEMGDRDRRRFARSRICLARLPYGDRRTPRPRGRRSAEGHAQGEDQRSGGGRMAPRRGSACYGRHRPKSATFWRALSDPSC
jgi:hypothetical protein